MEKSSPKLPVKLSCTVKDLINNKEITKDVLISVFHNNKWILWEGFEKDESLYKSFTSGKDYSFQFSGDGFFTKYANTSVDPEQTVLNLNVTLTPLPGNLFIKTEVPGLAMLLNGLPYYLEGSKYPEYKILPHLSMTGQKISLPAGNYSLTIIEERPWWKRISLFPPKLLPLRSDTLKITIHQGETLNVIGNTSIADGAIKLEIQ